MKNSHTDLLKQIGDMAAEGKFGDSIRASQAEYNSLPNSEAIILKTILDFVRETVKHAPEIAKIRNLACQLLIVAYREANRKDQSAAEAFLKSLTQDYPGVKESSILPRWSSLANASLAMREVADTNNRLLVWQQASRQFQASNEFLCGLFPFLIIMWRAAQGKTVSSSVFAQPFGQLVKQLSELTGGDNGIFYLFLRVARPKIRNAIAHENAWLDSAAAKVRYRDGRENTREYQIDLVEFMAIASTGSHIAHAYLAALAVIGVMQFGSDSEKILVPSPFSNAFTHPSTENAVAEHTMRHPPR